MLPAIPRGFFVCFEGIDQSGKKTQANALVTNLKDRGIQIEQMSFPDYSTPIGKEIRLALQAQSIDQPRVRHMLFAANRWERASAIERALRAGRLLIVNRFSASNYAFGGARGLPISWLENLERGLPSPNFIILLDISPETSLARKSARRDLHERDLKFLAEVRRIYLELAKSERWKIVDGDRDIDKVHQDVLQVTDKHLKKRFLVH